MRTGGAIGWIGAAGFAVLLFGTPLVVGSGSLRFVAASHALGCVLLGIAGVLAAFLDRRLAVDGAALRSPRRFVRMERAGVLLLAVGAAVPWFGDEVPLDGVMYLDRLGSLLCTLIGYLGGASLLRSGRSRALRRSLPSWLVAAMAMHVAAGLFRFAGGAQERMSGLVLQPNLFASIVVAFSLIPLVTLLARRRFVLAALVATAPAIAVLCSGSRAALVLAAGAMLFLAPLLPRGHRRGGVLLGCTAVAVLLVLAFVPNPLKTRIEKHADQSYPRSFIWRQSAGIAFHHPLGVGLGMHQYYFAQRAFLPEAPSLSFHRHEIGLAHNVVLGAAAEAGILGGVGVVLLLCAYLSLATGSRRRRLRHPRIRAAYCAALLLLVHAQVDGLAQNPIALGALIPLLALAESGLARRSPRAAHVAERRPVTAREFLVAAGCCIAVVIALAPAAVGLEAVRRMRAAATAEHRGDEAAAANSYLRALDRVNRNPSAALGLAGLARRRLAAANDDPIAAGGALLELDYWCNAATAANGLDTRGDVLLGQTRVVVHLASRRTDDTLLHAALRCFDRALLADPLDLDIRIARCRVLLLLKDDEAGISDLLEVLRVEPSHPLALQRIGEIELSRGRRNEAIARYQAAMAAWLAAQEKIQSGRYGTLSYLQKIVAGFDDVDCQMRIDRLRAGSHANGH